MSDKILQVNNLRTSFNTNQGKVTAVDGISFYLNSSETLGIVGESGCGKSVTSLTIMRLIPQPPGVIDSGEIFFKGTDLLKISEKDMQEVRGNKVSMIFQEPMTSLNPVFTIGNQIAEVFEKHQACSKKEAIEKSIEMLRKVGIPSPETRVNDYPHQLSGGMRQRVMIAIALACNPEILIADEPTTALDVTVQAQILELMKVLQKEYGMGLIMITHDLGVIAEVSDRIMVMYAGQVVEEGRTSEVLKNPKHPYTQGLIRSVPNPELEQERLQTIPGIVPSLFDLPKGCRFQERCTYKEKKCEAPEAQLLLDFENGVRAACWKSKEGRIPEVRL